MLSTIKNLGTMAKIGLGVGTVAVIAGSVLGVVGIANIIGDISDFLAEQQETSDSRDIDNVVSEVMNGEADNDASSEDEGKPENEQESAENDDEENDGVENNNTSIMQVAQRPQSNVASSASYPGQFNIGSSTDYSSAVAQLPGFQATKPSSAGWTGPLVSSTPAVPVYPSQPARPTQPTQPTTPVQPSEPEPKPDYNLNDNYVVAYCGTSIEGVGDINFTVIGKTVDEAQTECMAKLYDEVCKHEEYAEMTNEEIGETLGFRGSTGPLDETICTEHGWSCGRW